MMHQKSAEGKELKTVPKISMDYFYLNGKESEKGKSPMIAMTDEATGERYARMVAHKGLQEGEEGGWIISDMVDELR